MAAFALTAGAFVFAIAALLILLALLHACAAKAITGKWPHQSTKSKAVYDALNGATK